MSVEPIHFPVDEPTTNDLADGGGAPLAQVTREESAPVLDESIPPETALLPHAEHMPLVETSPADAITDEAKADESPPDESVAAAQEANAALLPAQSESPPTVVAETTAEDEVAPPANDDAPQPKPKAKPRKSKPKDAPATTPRAVSDKMVWYVLKVQSNREDSIRDAILRRLKIAGLDEFVGDVVVPTEKVMEIKDGKKRVVKRKFYPGYIIIQMEMNDDVWFTIRDTPGVGHFVGSGDKPVPMAEHEVAKMLGHQQEAAKVEQPKAKIPFAKGDRVTINEGPFENFEGDVEEINEDKGLVRVMIQIFGRPTPVDVEYWLASLVRN